MDKTTAHPAGDAAALAPLLTRLQGTKAFPALTASVRAINELTSAEDQNMGKLSSAILKDFGLTTNILRVANSPTYRSSSGDGISSVSRAISVLGLATVRNIALTVVLFEQMDNARLVKEIKDAILQAYLAGAIAREASASVLPRRTEEVYTSALLHSIGRVVAIIHFPDEMLQIRALVADQGLSDQEAARKVLGVDFSLLGQGVTEQWLFPVALVKAQRHLPSGVIERPQTADDTLWVLSGFGNEVCAALLQGPGTEVGDVLAALSERFAETLTISRTDLNLLVLKAFDEVKVVASTMGVKLGESEFIQRLGERVASGSDAPAAAGGAAAAGPPGTSASANKDAAKILAAGISKLNAAVASKLSLNDIFDIVQHALLEALDFQRIIICTRDDKAGMMVARMSRGKDATQSVRRLSFPLSGPADVFRLAVDNGVDIVINDIDEPKIAAKIPAWYRNIGAKTFALMPMMQKGKTVALIYYDKQQANSIVVAERQMNLIKTLRDQALLALKRITTG